MGVEQTIITIDKLTRLCLWCLDSIDNMLKKICMKRDESSQET